MGWVLEVVEGCFFEEEGEVMEEVVVGFEGREERRASHFLREGGLVVGRR